MSILGIEDRKAAISYRLEYHKVSVNRSREKCLIHYLKKPLQCVGVGIRMQRGHPRGEGIGPPQYYVPLRGASLCPRGSYYFVNTYVTWLTSVALSSQTPPPPLTLRARLNVNQLTKHPSSALLRP